MYEDTPQELVHDLIARGGLRLAPARAARDRHRRGDLDRSRGARSRATTARCTRRRTSSSRPPATSSTTGSSSSSQRVGRPPREPSRRQAARPPAARASRRSPACASSARTPSSTTSASARPASRAPTGAASPPRSSTRSSAARPRRASSRRSARSAAWPTPSTASLSQYADTGQIGIYVGTREDNLAEALAIAAEQIADIAAGSLARARARAREGEPQGAVLLSMESTSTRMNRLGKSLDHRLGDPLARPDRRRDRRGRAPRRSRELAGDAARARAALGRRDRAERGAVPRGARSASTPALARAA